MCVGCGRTFIRYNTLNKLCPLCLYNTYKSTARKPIKRFGSVTVKWWKARRKWLELNPPNHEGFWFCYICQAPLTIDQLTVDHIQSRGRNPELRFEQSNLAACCFKDNKKKGSLSLEEYLEKINA